MIADISLTSWQRNLWAIWFAELTSIVGFTVVMPILPLYIPQLGITDPQAVTFWAGAIFSAQAVTMAIMSPVWGMLADRYGRKLMVQRAMFSGAAVIGLMGFATSVQQLVLLRALQGALTGTVTAANTLVASTTPRERTGYAMGMSRATPMGGSGRPGAAPTPRDPSPGRSTRRDGTVRRRAIRSWAKNQKHLA